MGRYFERIRERLRNKPHLVLVKSNVYRIPERLRSIDSNLFVVLNKKTNLFEIHSLANKGDTFSLSVPFNELNAKVEEHVKKYDLKRHGRKIFQEMEAKQEAAEKAMERERQNRVRNLADEIHKPVRKLAYWGE